MPKGFFTLKDKIQYLFQKIDAGEPMLPVELDLLKAYTQNLVEEINANEEELLNAFNEQVDKKQSEENEFKSEPEKPETPIKNEAQETTNDRIVVDPQIDQPIDDSVEAEPNQEIESSEGESEVENAPEKEVSDEAQEAPKEDSSSENDVTFEAEFELEEKDQEEFQVNETPESELEKTDPTTEADKIVEQESSLDEPSFNDSQKTDTPISEETLENTDIPKPEPEIATDEDKEPDATSVQDQIAAVKEDETDEDYGIGLKFKKAKPLGELIDLSEKYIFIQGLFDQDPDRFSKALRKMDDASGVSEALDILSDYVVEGPDKSQNAELLQKLKAYLRIRFA